MGAIERARGDAAIFRQAFEKLVDEIVAVRERVCGADLQNEFEARVERGVIEIVGGFGGVPALGSGGWFGIGEAHRGESVLHALRGHPVERAGAHGGNDFGAAPAESCAEWAEHEFVSGRDEKIDVHRLDVDGHGAARLARVDEE